MTHKELLRVINARMVALGLGPRQLAAKLRGKVSQATVYNFVVNGRPARTDTLVAILNVLGLTVGASDER